MSGLVTLGISSANVDLVPTLAGHDVGFASPCCCRYEHPVKGQGIYAYVTLHEGTEYKDTLKKELVQMVREQIGAQPAELCCAVLSLCRDWARCTHGHICCKPAGVQHVLMWNHPLCSYVTHCLRCSSHPTLMWSCAQEPLQRQT